MEHRTWTGGRITAPGIYKGVPISFYHGDPCEGVSISSSGLRTIWSQSPMHYWCRSIYNQNKLADDDEPNEAFDLGRAAHHWLLGEEKFSEHFSISPFESYRTKEARIWRDGERAKGKTVVTMQQMAQVNGMRDGLMRHTMIREAGILDGHVERSLFWVEMKDVWLRARPDVIPAGSGDYVDLKTTVSIDRYDIARSIGQYEYAMQAAVLRIGCRTLGLPFQSFSLVFVEKTPPYCARVVTLKDHELDRGEKCVRAALNMFADGVRTGLWPGPEMEQADAEWIESPTWMQTRTDERLARLSDLSRFTYPHEQEHQS